MRTGLRLTANVWHRFECRLSVLEDTDCMHNRARDPVKTVAIQSRKVFSLHQVVQCFPSPAEKITEVLARHIEDDDQCRYRLSGNSRLDLPVQLDATDRAATAGEPFFDPSLGRGPQ